MNDDHASYLVQEGFVHCVIMHYPLLPKEMYLIYNSTVMKMIKPCT